MVVVTVPECHGRIVHKRSFAEELILLGLATLAPTLPLPWIILDLHTLCPLRGAPLLPVTGRHTATDRLFLELMRCPCVAFALSAHPSHYCFTGDGWLLAGWPWWCSGWC
jgi:hypothetical protein